MTATLTKTGRKNSYTAIIDAEDYERVTQLTWFLHKPKGCRTTYLLHRLEKGNLSLHRFILNAPKGSVVDHINGNGLDNRKANLRLCTPAGNARNRHNVSSLSTSGVTGVHQCPTTGKWVACVGATLIGAVVEMADAVFLRRCAEVLLFGEFAPNLDPFADGVLVARFFIVTALYQQWVADLAALRSAKEQAAIDKALNKLAARATAKTRYRQKAHAKRSAVRAQQLAAELERLQVSSIAIEGDILDLSFLDPCKLLDTPPQTA